ncbi:Qat anti-phage system TatD family nuclease QatD [Acinetobacter baumannii]|uniref:Qat anti-phage system TatD family nuclease QatD n=3 Tax=Acinetobacter baumannii TaxID=470 RepID=UPI0002BA9C07|nr:Qat anti-phage system TatD family nuclease QatD [Acinetobacter baumannii]EKU0267176.1 TatD family hydrolase [Acinetobacter baumannii]EKU0973608.1 TatD family hydrolase [Acinetobacter baumannii]EKU3586300.1 TatD family hydrolase [Acinetobacter baumannii]EKU3590537.1 TatD family hydrolase [Acinetobacter baumannii]EKU3600872.1 TatD family hydrolase [Acinetobacter baumannii]
MIYPYIDFHCHLDLYDDPHAIAKACGDSKSYILSVTTTPKAWFGTDKLTRHSARIKTALGLHPQLAHERYEELSLFDSLVSQTRYIGEIGLDGSPNFRNHAEIQKKVFLHILKKINSESPKILTIHSLKATKPVIELLNANFDNGIPVLHWFTGNLSELREALKAGCWFSINERMLKTEKGRQLVKHIPKNMILTETDGPFIVKTGAPLLPGEVQSTLNELADIWGVDPNEATAQIYENFKNLLINN